MSKTVRLSLVVGPEVPAMLAQLAGSKRGMGTFMQDLILREYEKSRSRKPSLEDQIAELRDRIEKLEAGDGA